jgi:hypothetical protein
VTHHPLLIKATNHALPSFPSPPPRHPPPSKTRPLHQIAVNVITILIYNTVNDVKGVRLQIIMLKQNKDQITCLLWPDNLSLVLQRTIRRR